MSELGENMFLYWGSGSPPCWKSMIVLAEKGLWDSIQKEQLQFDKKEHKSEKVLKLNPRGQLPTFRDGDVVVNESGAICMYLEDKCGDTNRLMPQDAEKRANVYQRMFETANVQSTLMEKLAYYLFMTKKEDLDQKLLNEKVQAAQDELKRWEDILGKKDYLCGDTFTMADVFFFPFLAFLVHGGAKLTKQPSLKAYHDRVSQRPSVQATWPPHWKENDGTGMFSDKL